MGIQWTFDSSVQDRISSGESETWLYMEHSWHPTARVPSQGRLLRQAIVFKVPEHCVNFRGVQTANANMAPNIRTIQISIARNLIRIGPKRLLAARGQKSSFFN